MADTNLTVRIGAALSKSFKATFGQAEAGASSLGKSYANVNKQLKDVRAVRRYQRELDDLRRRGRQADQSEQEFQRELKKTERALERTQRKVSGYGHSLESLGRVERKLGRRKYLNEIGMRLGDRAGMFRNAGYAVGGAVTAGSVGAFYNTNRVAQQLDSAQKFSQRVNVDPRAVQELDYVAQRNGLEVDRMRDALQEQSVRIGEAIRGEGEALPALQALNLAPSQLGQVTPDQQMEMIADALAKVPNRNVRLSLADQLYGDPGQELSPVLGQGGEAIRRQRAEARATGNTFGREDTENAAEYAAALQDAQARLSGLAGMLGTTLMPAFTDLFQSFSSRFDRQQDIKGTLKEWRDELGRVLSQARALGTGMMSVLRPMGQAIGGIVAGLGGWENAGKLLAALMAGRLIGSVLGLGGAFKSLLGLGVSGALKGMAAGGKGLAGMLGRLVPAASGLAGVATTLGGVLAGGLTKAIGIARVAVVGLGRALLLNPIGLAVTAIAGAAYLIYQNWEPIKSWSIGLWDSVVTTFSGAWESVKSLMSWSPIGMVWKIWSGLFEFPGKIFDTLKDKFTGAFPNLSKVIKDKFGEVYKIASGWFDRISKKFEGVKEFFGFETEGSEEVGSDASTAPRRPPVSMNDTFGKLLNEATAKATSAPQVNQTNTTTIQANVYQNPGEDSESLARRTAEIVRDEHDRRERERAEAQRGSLHDAAF